MALTKITANIIEDGAISTASLADTSITADKLHTTLDLTGKTITVATATAGDNDTTVASTAFVSTAIANLADSAPETLNTLNELAAALGDDANFSTTVTNSIALKAPLASPTFTGTVEIPNLTISSAQGTDGQVLTSTGSGIAWEDAAGGVDGIVSSANATAITIDSSENVGIGENTPSRKLHINGPDGSTNLVEGNSRTALFLDNAGATYMNFASANSSNAGIFFSDTDANNRGGVIYEHANDALTFDSAGTERMRIDSSGNVGIGETNPTKLGLTGSSTGKVLALGGDDCQLRLTYTVLHHDHTGNTTTHLRNHYGSLDALARMKLESGYITFHTGTAFTEAVRIDSSRSLFINTTSGYGTPGYSNMWIQHSSGRQRGIAFKATSTSSTDTPCQFFNGGAGIAGQITYTYSATTYSTSSDYRLKENVVYDWDATTRLKQLKPCRFNWIADETNTAIDGFIAHEAAEVVPNSVVGEKDATKDAFLDADGNEIPGSTIDAQTMDHAKLVPLLVKTIQELEERITALEG